MVEDLRLGGAAGVDVVDRRDLGRTSATRLGRERLRADAGEIGLLALEGGGHDRVATEDGRADLDGVAIDLDVVPVGERGAIDLDREAAHGVTAVVALR